MLTRESVVRLFPALATLIFAIFQTIRNASLDYLRFVDPDTKFALLTSTHGLRTHFFHPAIDILYAPYVLLNWLGLPMWHSLQVNTVLYALAGSFLFGYVGYKLLKNGVAAVWLAALFLIFPALQIQISIHEDNLMSNFLLLLALLPLLIRSNRPIQLIYLSIFLYATSIFSSLALISWFPLLFGLAGIKLIAAYKARIHIATLHGTILLILFFIVIRVLCGANDLRLSQSPGTTLDGFSKAQDFASAHSKRNPSDYMDKTRIFELGIHDSILGTLYGRETLGYPRNPAEVSTRLTYDKHPWIRIVSSVFFVLLLSVFCFVAYRRIKDRDWEHLSILFILLLFLYLQFRFARVYAEMFSAERFDFFLLLIPVFLITVRFAHLEKRMLIIAFGLLLLPVLVFSVTLPKGDSWLYQLTKMKEVNIHRTFLFTTDDIRQAGWSEVQLVELNMRVIGDWTKDDSIIFGDPLLKSQVVKELTKKEMQDKSAFVYSCSASERLFHLKNDQCLDVAKAKAFSMMGILGSCNEFPFNRTSDRSSSQYTNSVSPTSSSCEAKNPPKIDE